jgi:hypothetical protein
MALRLYRRHRKECEAGHPEDLKSRELTEVDWPELTLRFARYPAAQRATEAQRLSRAFCWRRSEMTNVQVFRNWPDGLDTNDATACVRSVQSSAAASPRDAVLVAGHIGGENQA